MNYQALANAFTRAYGAVWNEGLNDGRKRSLGQLKDDATLAGVKAVMEAAEWRYKDMVATRDNLIDQLTKELEA